MGNENVLYYLFSTIAASFGSTAGFLIAAAVFRLQRIDTIGARLVEGLIKELTEDRTKRLRRIQAVCQWEKVRDAWAEARGTLEKKFDNEGTREQQEATLWVLDKVFDRLNEIRCCLRLGIVLTFCLIGACFLCIGLTPCIKDSLYDSGLPFACPDSLVNPWATFIITFAGFLLYIYGRLTWLVTAPPTSPTRNQAA